MPGYVISAEAVTSSFYCILWYTDNLSLAASLAYFGIKNPHAFTWGFFLTSYSPGDAVTISFSGCMAAYSSACLPLPLSSY